MKHLIALLFLCASCGDSIAPSPVDSKDVRVGSYIQDEIPVYASSVDGFIPLEYGVVSSLEIEGDEMFFVFKNEELRLDISSVGKGDLIVVRPSFGGSAFGVDVINGENKDRLCEEYKSLPDPSVRSFFACGE